MSERKKVVFVPRRSRIRLYKIAKAVKESREYEMVLICEQSYFDDKLFDGLFDEVLFYSKSNVFRRSRIYKYLSKIFVISPGIQKMIRLINAVNPDLVHAFCEPYDHIERILKQTTFPVIMTDGADFSGISTGIDQLDNRTRTQEKYCFENVHGLAYKGPQYVTDFYRKFGYDIKCPELTWMDMTDEDLFTGSDKYNEELHVVYTGNVSTDPNKKYCYYIPLAKQLAAQKIHFHVFANPYQYKTSKEYQELDQSSPYFHWEKPLPLKELIPKISEYDWGLWVHAEDPSSRTTPDKMRTGMVNKMFTYLEAGLPVVVSDSRKYGVETVEKHELGFALNDKDWGNMKKIINNYDYDLLRKRILAKRKELSLQQNHKQLTGFYKEVLNYSVKSKRQAIK